MSLTTIDTILSDGFTLRPSEQAKLNTHKCRQYRDAKLAASDAPFYGIDTGFGSLHNVKTSQENLTKLQENLVKSHACAVREGKPQRGL